VSVRRKRAVPEFLQGGSGSLGASLVPVVTFDALLHEYRVDGRRVSHITGILDAAGMVPDYSRIPPATLAYARDRGAHVDVCCDLLDDGDLDWTSVHPECLPYVQAWQKFKDRERFVPIVSQGVLYHQELDYAGTPDVYGLIDKVATIVERKCTAKLSETYSLQTAAQAMPGIGLAVDETEGELLPLTVARRLVVQLRKDGTFAVYDCEQEAKKAGRDDFSAFRAAVEIAKWKGCTNGNGTRR
jgi:hypothetical protein